MNSIRPEERAGCYSVVRAALTDLPGAQNGDSWSKLHKVGVPRRLLRLDLLAAEQQEEERSGRWGSCSTKLSAQCLVVLGSRVGSRERLVTGVARFRFSLGPCSPDT